MQVQEIMTGVPACCTPETKLQEVARMMVEHDCGAIPVVKGDRQELAGIVTDRDIVCRTVAEGKNPLQMTAAECMTDTVVSISPDADLEDCCRIMQQHQIRRVPVVDQAGVCRGIVSQADLAQHVSQPEAGEVVKQVSQQTEGAAAI